MAQYGDFSADRREFVITDPRTPRPWFNYIGNGHLLGLVSHTGGGFSFLESPRDNRLTRMRYNCLPWDRPGRTVMLRDAESGQYWSLSWAPTLERDYTMVHCHHGQGYTRIITRYDGIEAELTYFVMPDHDAEIWWVQLRNDRDHDCCLDTFAFAEVLMGNALNDLINQPNDKHFSDVHFEAALPGLVATRRYWVLNQKVSVAQPNRAWGSRLYFGQTHAITGFDGSLDAFIGRWRSEANPLAVEQGQCRNSEITAGDPLVALQGRLRLAAGETTAFAIVMAVAEAEAAAPDLAYLSDLTTVAQQFERLQQYWDHYLGHAQITSPDPEFDTMLNVWNPYQAATTFAMARNAGYYHGGLLFGTGMRDQCQDIMGMVMVEPQRVRDRLLEVMQYQFADGSTLHNFFRLTGSGEKTNHSDTPLWLPFGVLEYLRETGDWSLLDETVRFYDGGEASVYDHACRAVDWAIANLSERGLPLIHKGDWNDTLDYVGAGGKGETVWGGCWLAYIIRRWQELLGIRADQETAARWQAAYGRLAEVINRDAWDGAWYRRAFKDNGEAIGTAEHDQGQIFLNAQSWAILAGIAPPERAELALHSCQTHLLQTTGMQICWPAYRRVEPDVGLISRCVPGKKENGAVFNHASSWFVLAALQQGAVDLAWDVYARMLPLRESRNRDRYELEPYVFAEYVTSSEHPTEGQASHSWLTGTAVWMYRIGLDWIAGIRPELSGVVIDPHIPSHWPKLEVRRVLRGHTLSLTVHNPHGRTHGIRSMQVNGTPVEGNTLDYAALTGETIAIAVTL